MSGSSVPPPWVPPRWLMGVVLAAAALAFVPTLAGGFLADDFAYIARFRELPWSEWPKLFIRDWSGGIWGEPLRELRPFVALSFMGDARLFGGNALGYRLTNLTLHLLATFLVMRLAWKYSISYRQSTPSYASVEQATLTTLIAGLVFGLHPAHAEAVGWITGRVDLQATAAALLFWFGAERYAESGSFRRAILALTAFFLGIFSKELCLFAPLLLLLRWVLLESHSSRAVWQRRLLVLGGVVAILVFYGVCRRVAFGHDSIGYNLWTDEPAWHRQAHYAGWLLPVLPFSARGEWEKFPSLAVLHGIWLTMAISILGGLSVALWRKAYTASAALFFAGVWYLATVFPMTGVVYFSPRHLYFPSVGIALAIGFLCAAARWRRSWGAVFVVWMAAGHFTAIQPWRASAAVSRDALSAVRTELAKAAPDALLVTSVPETFGPTLLWAWSSPPCFSRPFLDRLPAKIMERPANYTQSATWTEDRRPLETVRGATDVVALYVDVNGRVSCRRISGPDWPVYADTFAATVATGLSPESWSAWVKSVAAAP